MAYLQFLGAAGTVTGSKHLINTGADSSGKQGLQVLLDCGMFQGPKEWRLRNWEKTPVPANEIDAVILTHAHLDHCGWIPRLVKEGFKGPEDCMGQFQPVAFDETKQISQEISFRFVHAGHILGSCMVELFFRENGRTRKFLFTGDIGRVPVQPTAPGRVVRAGPDTNEDPELLVMESTYGNRVHPHEDVRPQLAQIINDAVHRGGSIVIPAFAVERTQKFLFLIKALMESNSIPRIPAFTDSPMAIKAVEIFMKYSGEFNDEAQQLVQRYGSPLNWEGFHFAPKQEDSKKINEVRYPCIIVSSSGMVTGGRILHHLMLRLSDPRNQVIFIGFQAPGTRGEIIKRGAKSVRIYSQEVPIRAHVAALEQFSDHADTEELLRWLQTFKKPPVNTFLVHGEPEAASLLQQTISSKLGWSVKIAHWLEKVQLG